MKKWNELTRQDFMMLAEHSNGKRIAEHFGVTPGAVYYYFRIYGINKTRARKFQPPKEELQNLYTSMSMADIAKHYGVGETVVFMRLKEYGIGGISRSERLTGRPKSQAHRQALSKSKLDNGSNAGDKNPNWKGGISSEKKRGRSKSAYFLWKQAVLSNAGWKCQACSVEHGRVCECCGHKVLLHAHHLQSFSDNEALRYEPSNGKALCERCHRLEHH